MSLWPDLAFGLMLLLFLWAPLIFVLVFVKRLLVLPPVLLSLPEAYGTGIGDVPSNLLFALPLLHVTLDSLEARVLTEVNTDNDLGVANLQFYWLTFPDGLSLILTKGDVLDMLQLIHALVQLYGALVAHHQTASVFIQLNEHLTAVLSVADLLADGFSLTKPLLFLLTQSEVVYDVTMNGVGHQHDTIVFIMGKT